LSDLRRRFSPEASLCSEGRKEAKRPPLASLFDLEVKAVVNPDEKEVVLRYSGVQGGCVRGGCTYWWYRGRNIGQGTPSSSSLLGYMPPSSSSLLGYIASSSRHIWAI